MSNQTRQTIRIGDELFVPASTVAAYVGVHGNTMSRWAAAKTVNGKPLQVLKQPTGYYIAESSLPVFFGMPKPARGRRKLITVDGRIFHSVAAAARNLGISQNTLRVWVYAGHTPHGTLLELYREQASSAPFLSDESLTGIRHSLQAFGKPQRGRSPRLERHVIAPKPV